ncbi:Periplakin, partial [Nibea albiflora]
APSTEVSALIDKLKKTAFEVSKNFLDAEEKLSKDVSKINEGKQPLYQEDTNKKILNSLELLPDLDEDVVIARGLGHPQAESIKQDMKNLRDRAMKLQEDHVRIYDQTKRRPGIDWSNVMDEKLDKLKNMGFGQELASVEDEIEEHNIFHSEVEALAPQINSSGDKASSSSRQRNLLSLQDYMRHCTDGLYWVLWQVEERIGYDWSDTNLDYAARQRQYEDSKCLESKEANLTQLYKDGEKLIAAEHPGKNGIEAYMNMVIAAWSEYQKYKKDQAKAIDRCHEQVKALQKSSLQVLPLKYRRETPQELLPIEALCEAHTDEVCSVLASQQKAIKEKMATSKQALLKHFEELKKESETGTGTGKVGQAPPADLTACDASVIFADKMSGVNIGGDINLSVTTTLVPAGNTFGNLVLLIHSSFRPAAKMITEQKVKLIKWLMADHSFILQYVHAKEIVTDRQYRKLKYTSEPENIVTDLIDCVIFKDCTKPSVAPKPRFVCHASLKLPSPLMSAARGPKPCIAPKPKVTPELNGNQGGCINGSSPASDGEVDEVHATENGLNKAVADRLPAEKQLNAYILKSAQKDVQNVSHEADDGEVTEEEKEEDDDMIQKMDEDWRLTDSARTEEVDSLETLWASDAGLTADSEEVVEMVDTDVTEDMDAEGCDAGEALADTDGLSVGDISVNSVDGEAGCYSAESRRVKERQGKLQVKEDETEDCTADDLTESLTDESGLLINDTQVC